MNSCRFFLPACPGIEPLNEVSPLVLPAILAASYEIARFAALGLQAMIGGTILLACTVLVLIWLPSGVAKPAGERDR
jgi:hypothetical protein